MAGEERLYNKVISTLLIPYAREVSMWVLPKFGKTGGW